MDKLYHRYTRHKWKIVERYDAYLNKQFRVLTQKNNILVQQEKTNVVDRRFFYKVLDFKSEFSYNFPYNFMLEARGLPLEIYFWGISLFALIIISLIVFSFKFYKLTLKDKYIYGLHLILQYFCMFWCSYFFIFCDNFLVLLICWVSLSLIIIWHLIFSINLYKLRAVLLYFFISTLSTICLLFGLWILYYTIGCIHFTEIYYALQVMPLNLYWSAIIFIFIAICLKVSIGPFFFWGINVNSRLNFLNISFMNIIPKLTYLIFLYNFIMDINVSYQWVTFMFILIVGIFSIVIGILNGIEEKNIRQLLGYSALLNLGIIFTLLGYTLIEPQMGIISFGDFLGIYFFVALVSYLIFFLFFNRYVYLNQLIFVKLSIMNIFAILVIFFLMGLPPSLYFFMKINIFQNFIIFLCILKSYNLISYIFIILILGCLKLLGLFPIFYYLNILKIIIFDQKRFKNYISVVKYDFLLYKFLSVIISLVFFNVVV